MSFLSELYPVRWQVSDLGGQVDAFLALPSPKKHPRETLWVFSFGMWDVWSMAAFPRQDALLMIDTLAAGIFSNIERLYQASLDPRSIAYSENSVKLPATRQIRNSTNAAQASRKHFRILLPSLLDPSLTPAWQLDRPDLPSVHSKSEQMRNAAALTHKWNMATRNYMDTWVRTSRSEPICDVECLDDDLTKNGGIASIPNISASKKRSVNWSKSNLPVQKSERSVADESKIYPQRDAVLYDLPQYLLDVIIDRQFREAGISDQEGFGYMPSKQTFLDVAIPCVHDPSLLDPEEDYSTVEDDFNSDYDQTLSKSRGDVENGPQTMDVELMGNADLESRRERTKDRPAVCIDPDEHLFYTGSTLGQRAIREIGRQAAAMVQNNDTLRAFWDGIGKSAKRKKSGPGHWPERHGSSVRRSSDSVVTE
jgi:hypothetical protein